MVRVRSTPWAVALVAAVVAVTFLYCSVAQAQISGLDGSVARGSIGVKAQNVTKEAAEAFRVKPGGALIYDVIAGGPAEAAGLKKGDIVVKLNGEAIKVGSGLSSRIAGLVPGTTAELVVIRAGAERTLTVTIGRVIVDEVVIHSGSPFAGLTVANLSYGVAEELGVDEGILIIRVPEDSSAKSAGFQPGDIIVSVNNEKMTSTGDLERVIKEQVTKNPQKAWLVLRRRGGEMKWVAVKGP
jgi:S1-C subfamily serine protease